jgi:fructokinase
MPENRKPELCIFGEVLFDHFPDGSTVLGGAPFNVAWHLQALGEKPCFISRVGNDSEGAMVRKAMQRWGMCTEGLQNDPDRPTGRVQVRIVEDEPHYDIVEDCAYDAIEPYDLAGCGLLYHGTLAARAERSARSLMSLRNLAPEKIFIDVNLRPPWWDRKLLQELLSGADWVKLNEQELATLRVSDARVDASARTFLRKHGLESLVVTHGARGAEMVMADGEHIVAEPEQGSAVVDTVGAGDALTAILILGISRGWPHSVTLQRAQQFASMIVGKRGATVEERDFYQPFVDAWQLAAGGEPN